MPPRVKSVWDTIKGVSTILSICVNVILILSSPYIAPTVTHFLGYSGALTAVTTQSITITNQMTMTLSTTHSTTYSTTFSTTLSSTSMTTTTLSSTMIYQMPNLGFEVYSPYSWLPSPNGRLAIIPDNQSVTFQIRFKNNANFELDFWGFTTHIQFVPSSLHSDYDFSSYSEVHLSPSKNATLPWTYGTNLPHFPVSGEAIITLTIYSLDGAWKTPIVINAIFVK
jgi:hypothetical protein